jgi:PAS domain S-box-containing protein
MTEPSDPAGGSRRVDVELVAQVLEAAPSGVIVLDLSGVMLAANDATAQIVGRPLAELVGIPLQELFVPDQHDRVTLLLAEASDMAPSPVPDRPFRLVDPRAERYLELRRGPPLDVREGVVALLVLRDVTERVRAARARRRASTAQALLAETSDLLESPLDPAQTLQRIAALAVPAHAELCVIDLIDDDGALQGAAMASVDPQVGEALTQIRDGYPLDPASRHPVAKALRTGRPLLVDAMDDDSYEQFASGPEHLALMRRLRYRSALVVPLTARGRTFGVISLLYLSAGLRYTEDDLQILVDVARRSALALDNARLYAREHRIAVTLQRSLLPGRLPELPGLTLAARYEPGDGDVGGDWYDVVALPDGRVGCVVGDIVGRGIDAASAMGQLRSAVRVYAAERRSAGEVLSAVDLLARSLGVGFMATLVYLIVDAAGETVELASAGHPPPLLLTPDRGARYLSSGRSAPLGVGDAERRLGATEPFPSGSTLVLYTDGLIERRGEPLDAGLHNLATIATAAPAEPERLVDTIVGTLRDGVGEDDVAVLAIRSSPSR